MLKLLTISKSIYLVDDEDKSFRFFKRNRNRKGLSDEQNERNRASLDGYTRIFRNDTTKKFSYRR